MIQDKLKVWGPSCATQQGRLNKREKWIPQERKGLRLPLQVEQDRWDDGGRGEGEKENLGLWDMGRGPILGVAKVTGSGLVKV